MGHGVLGTAHHNQPAIEPDSILALGVDKLTRADPDVKWPSTTLNTGWLNPT